MFKNLILTLLLGALLCVPLPLTAQTVYAKDQVTKENLKTTNWFALKYQYLDADYNVTMDSLTYQKALATYNLPGLLMNTYTDSVAVAMIMEFDNWDIANVAITKVGYSWTKMGYYLWLSAQETEALAKKMGFKHAYLFRNYISNQENNSEEITSLLNAVANKLKANGHTEYEQNSRAEFMTYAYKQNPDKNAFYAQKRAKKKRLMQHYKERRGQIDRMKIGVGCEEANCCQKQTEQ